MMESQLEILIGWNLDSEPDFGTPLGGRHNPFGDHSRVRTFIVFLSLVLLFSY